MSSKRVDGFFYGLFMDVALLKASGVMAENPRKAYVDGYSLRIGNRATLVPAEQGRAYGMVLALTHDELDILYGAPGLENYRPEALLVTLMDGGSLPALCYNLLETPPDDERNRHGRLSAFSRFGFACFPSRRRAIAISPNLP